MFEVPNTINQLALPTPAPQQDLDQKQISDVLNFKFGSFDLLEFLSDCENQNEVVLAQQSVTSTQSHKQMLQKGSPNIPTFNNCHISGNITTRIS